MSSKKKYLLTFRGVQEQLFHAGSKVYEDMASILISRSYEPVSIPYINKTKSERRKSLPGLIAKLLFGFLDAKEICCIYPDTVKHDTVVALLNLVKPMYRLLGIKTTALVIDLDSIRFCEGNIQDDLKYLKPFDHAIVHSPRMERLLVDNGYKGTVTVMGLMDYRVKEVPKETRSCGNDVCFAGNLGKSGFVTGLKELDLQNTRFLIYGKNAIGPFESDKVIYKGVFFPEDLSNIEGNWGLIWDGDSTLAKDGYLANYLSLNSPHKASMYLCAGMPLIAPDWSFTGDLVKKHGLGIVISSLADIDDAIAAISAEQYAEMLENVKAYAARLMNGRNVLDAMGLE